MPATCSGSLITPSSVVPSARLLMLIRQTSPSRSSRSRPTRARRLVSASKITSWPSCRATGQPEGRPVARHLVQQASSDDLASEQFTSYSSHNPTLTRNLAFERIDKSAGP